jgi:hypothetical protein
MYRQQWQADQMAGKCQAKKNEGKRKNNDRNHQNSNGGQVVLAKAIPAEGEAEDVEEAVEYAAEEETTVII